MSLNARKIKSESKFDRPDPLEAGSYPARTVQMIGLGLQKQRPFKGEEKLPKQELYITYEMADEFLLDEDGNEIEDKPRWLSETIPMNSLDSDLAKSTKRYMALDPTLEHDGAFDKVVDVPCLITISQDQGKDGKVYNNIRGVQTMRSKDIERAPDLVNEPRVFDFYEPNLDTFLALPKWLQDKMKESLDYDGSELEKLLDGAGEEQEKEEKKSKKKAKKKEEEAGDDEEDDDVDW